MGKVISAEAFLKKATRLIEIPGFEPEEVFTVRVKPVSIMSMMMQGKLPNSLLQIVNGLFDGKTGPKDVEHMSDEELGGLLSNTEQMRDLSNMMRKVCEEALLEPTYEEIGQAMTDEQVQSIFNQLTARKVDELKPSSGE